VVIYRKIGRRMVMETQSVRIAVRSRYGRAASFLASLTVVVATQSLKVYIFDLPAPQRIYAWRSPVTGELVVIPHGRDARSPREAVAHPDARELGT
jgi:hypothetical protein